MRELFLSPGVAHSLLVLAATIGIGLLLAKIKVKGVSLGATWILFVGIFFGHIGFTADAEVLRFVKEAGLILFVFSIGLQVGPGFFHSLGHGGLNLNLLAAMNILLAVLLTWGISAIFEEDLMTMVGVMSGAVTNTPGLGAAQQTIIDVAADAEASAKASTLASGYAVAYPLGVLGVILSILFLKSVFKIDPAKEEAEIKSSEDASELPRRMHVRVENPAIFGKTIFEVIQEFGADFVISRIMKGDDILFPSNNMVLEKDDKLLLVTTQQEVDKARIIFGQEIPMHVQDWMEKDHNMVIRRLTVSKPSLTGTKLKDLHIRSAYNVNITRVIRAGVELMAHPSLILQMGDGIVCVGPEKNIKKVADKVGNTGKALDKPNLIPIFIGIFLGILVGSIPIRFPGIPQSIKFGLAGGPLIVAILLGHFGPKYHITTYTTMSANLMLREVGIAIFLASVGLSAGSNFVSSIASGGYWWILYGALITIIPNCITFIVAKVLCHMNFFQICGLIAGSCTNPPVLAFSQEMFGSDYTSVNYATVYPLSMFLRVMAAQILILLAFAG